MTRVASRPTEVRTTVPPLLTALVLAPERVVVRLTGDADVSTAPLIRRVLGEAAGTGVPLVVVDLTAARFWDVSGLHELAACTSALAADDRQCRLVGASRATRRLITLADLTGSLRLDGPAPAPARRGPAPTPTAEPDRADAAPIRGREQAHGRRSWRIGRRSWRIGRRSPAAATRRSRALPPHVLAWAVGARRWR